MIAALKFEYLSIQYQLFKVLASAKFAIFVFTLGQIKEFFFWIFFVTDQAGLICSGNWRLSLAGLLIIIRYLDASFPYQLLLLHQIDLVDNALFIEVMVIVFKPYNPFCLVILMSKM
jgi:hypothetical protein